MRASRRILTMILMATPMAAFANADPYVNPNRDSVEEMQENLIGVTDGMALDIVQYRGEHGYFDSKKDLLKVQGIGRDDLNINRNYLYLEDSPDRRQVSG